MAAKWGASVPFYTAQLVVHCRPRGAPMPPTRPLLIWAWIAIACAVILTAEGTMLLSGRRRQLHGWLLGILLLLGNFFAVGLAARLYDISTELLRLSCNCEPFLG